MASMILSRIKSLQCRGRYGQLTPASLKFVWLWKARYSSRRRL